MNSNREESPAESLGKNYEALVMPAMEYEHWLNIIKSDDDEALHELFEKGSTIERAMLLYGRFEYDELVTSYKYESTMVNRKNFRRPFILAATSLSKRCLKVFWQRQVNISLEDINGDNIFHAICWAAELRPYKEADYALLIKEIVRYYSLGEMIPMFSEEDNHALRPLELAAVLQQYKLVNTIMGINGIYRFPIAQSGMYINVLYDVTGYEFDGNGNEDRTEKSPLMFLAEVTAEKFSEPHSREFIISPLVKKWSRIRSSQFSLILFFWTFARVMYVFNYAFLGGELIRHELHDKNVSRYYQNLTGAKSCDVIGNAITQTLDDMNLPLIPLYCSLSCVCFILLFDLTDLVIYLMRRCRKSSFYHIAMDAAHERDTLVENHNFRWMMCFQAIYTLALFFFIHFIPQPPLEELLTEREMTLEGLLLFFYSFSTVVNFWTLLFFVQLSRLMGHFVIAFSKMITQMLRFLILYGLISLSFNHAFYSLTTLTCLPTQSTWDAYMHGWYRTFLLSLNIFEAPAMQRHSIQLAYQMVHVVYVFVVAVLMINFLIAVMAYNVALISGSEGVINMLTKLSVYQIIHRRVGWVMVKIMPDFYLRKYVIRDGHIFILCYEKLADGENVKSYGQKHAKRFSTIPLVKQSPMINKVSPRKTVRW